MRNPSYSEFLRLKCWDRVLILRLDQRDNIFRLLYIGSISSGKLVNILHFISSILHEVGLDSIVLR